ncbi:MAG: UvrD-helicase domain-containing protein [Alistipes sp.]
MRAKILNASAGSGKTYQLAYKYVRDVIETPNRYRHILAVTFTNKATEEMKSRILERIHELATDAPSDYLSNLCTELQLDAQTIHERARCVQSKILHDYSHFTVLTIDKFFQRILRAFIRELGIAPDYNTEIESEQIVSRSADLLIEQITIDAELRKWLLAFVEERIDESRRWDIREGILSLKGELFKEQNREQLNITHSKEELSKIINDAIAAAQKSQNQMQQVAQKAVAAIGNAGLSVQNFYYKATGFANYFYKIAQGTLDAYPNRVRSACTDDEPWSKSSKEAQALQTTLQPLLQQLCAIYDQHSRSWNTTALLRQNYRSFALLADLSAQVQQTCNEENMMLLSETKYILSKFIDNNDTPFIYEKVGSRFDRFMIDEFQDTSTREWENFLPLLQNAMAQSADTSVLLVGDIKQSIYRFRGGDWRILHTKAQEALGAGETEMSSLTQNHRSLATIVEFNNRIIGKVVASDNSQLNALLFTATENRQLTENEKVELTDTLSAAYCDHTQTVARKSECMGYVRVATFVDEPPMVECICEVLDRGFRPCDILILVASNSEGARIAETLLDFKRQNTDSRHNFDVMTQEALVMGNAAVCAFIIATMRLTINPKDSMSRAIYNDYLGQRMFDAPLSDEELLFFRSVRLLSPEEAFERLVMQYNLQTRPQETAYLQAIHEAIIHFCARKTADLPLFLKWWDEDGCTQSLSVEQSETTIGIMTIHKAKGLQNKVVILPSCSWKLSPGNHHQPVVWGKLPETNGIGRFPVYYQKSLAESHFSVEYYRELVYSHVDRINQLYVALTRAEESLYLFIDAEKTNHVGDLILDSFEVEKNTCYLDGTEGRYTETENGEIFEFGEVSAPAVQRKQIEKVAHIVLENYLTSEADLRLRLPSQRYFDGDTEAELAPRNLGILMHRAFENAETETDIFQAINDMRTDALISEAEVTALHTAISRVLDAYPVAHEWFGANWDKVRNEHEIIVPGDSHVRRPDRVMLHGERAVVVDYKFGTQQTEQHKQQICEYVELLQRIGYKHTEGYLWYVKLGTIEKII